MSLGLGKLRRHDARMTTMQPTIPDVQARREIGVRAMMGEKQVLKVYRAPERCRPSVVARVARAADELGLPPPRREAA